MAEAVVDLFEAIEVEQHDRQRLAVDLLARQQRRGAVEKSPPVGDAAQRIDQRIDLVFELGALLGLGRVKTVCRGRSEQGEVPTRAIFGFNYVRIAAISG